MPPYGVEVVNGQILYFGYGLPYLLRSSNGTTWEYLTTDGLPELESEIQITYADGYYLADVTLPRYGQYYSRQATYVSTDLQNWSAAEASHPHLDGAFGVDEHIFQFDEALWQVSLNGERTRLWPAVGMAYPSQMIAFADYFALLDDSEAEDIFIIEQNGTQVSRETLPEGGWYETLSYDPQRGRLVATGAFEGPLGEAQPTIWLRNSNTTFLSHGATQYDRQFFVNPWLGSYWELGTDWIYHSTLDYLYVWSGSSPQNLWAYHQQQGWLWTNQAYYPWVYVFDQGIWQYQR